MSRILVIDDSLTVRMDLVEALTEAGHSPVGCRDLAQARAALQTPADAVVLDVHLPDGDGLELLDQLKADRPDLPVLLLTQEREVADRLRDRLHGPDAFVGKPYVRDDVLSQLEVLIARSGAGAAPLLVVDDSATWREALREAFEAEGYPVVTAETGERALELAQEIAPRALIIDGQMPGLDGQEVVRKLRLDLGMHSLPCLLVTAEESGIAELQALEAGTDAYVRKEAGTAVIVNRMQALLRRTVVPLAGQAQPSGRRRLLAVDDSPTFLGALRDELLDQGYDVLTADNGADAIELLGKHTVDAVLMDLMMPGMSGADACRIIKENPKLSPLPILILTGMEERQAMVEAINAGADDYVPKSDDFAVLRARLVAHLRRRQVEQAHQALRDELVRREMEAAEARAAVELSETRATLLAEVEAKNVALERANSALQEARDLAQAQTKFKTRFLANMSHELRTPLNAIIGFSELLESGMAGPLNDEQGRFITLVVDSGRHLLSLINDILDLTKVEAGRTELHRELGSVAPVVQAAIEVIRPLADRRQQTLEVELREPIPELAIDGRRIKQVLYNLLSNAVKFTPVQGTITCTTWATPHEVFVAVRDTGPGIRDEDWSKLFKEFEQIEPQQGTKPEGTGLGLALSRRLAEMHGGRIVVETEVGKGSCFTLRLPRISASSGLLSMEAPLPKLLIVDDDPDALDLLARHARSVGVSVDLAMDAASALKAAAAGGHDAVLLDIRLPDRDGWSVLEELRASPVTKDTPVVIVSALGQPARGLLSGATDYLHKPVTRNALLGSLRILGIDIVPMDEPVAVCGPTHEVLEQASQELAKLGVEVTRHEAAADAPSEAALIIGRTDLPAPGRPWVELAEIEHAVAVGDSHIRLPQNAAAKPELIIRAAAWLRGEN